jgi:hypothetical protein
MKIKLMKCISVCFKRIGSGRVYKLTDTSITSDLIMLDSDILDPFFVPLNECESQVPHCQRQCHHTTRRLYPDQGRPKPQQVDRFVLSPSQLSKLHRLHCSLVVSIW